MYKVTLLLIAFSLFVTYGNGLLGIFDQNPQFLFVNRDLNINDLNDVQITGVFDNQVIVFDSATGLWVNEAQAGLGSRQYTGLSPVSIDNDANVIALNILPTSDWNGQIGNSVDGNTLWVRLDPDVGQVISGDFDLNHLDGHSFFGHTFFLGDADDEVVLIKSGIGQGEHVLSVVNANDAHLFTIEPNGTVDINFFGTEEAGHALHIDIDANGFPNIVGLEFDFVVGDLGIEEEVQVILIEVDQFGTNFGQVDGIQIVATQGDANIHFAEIGILIDPITQLSGVFGDMDSAFVAGVDQLAAFTSFDTNVAMFVNDDDNVLIGNAEQFAEIEFILQTVASGGGIKPVFEHSTGVGTFSTFSPTDTTEGMRSTGVIVFDLEIIPDWEVGANNEFLIRITRTRNSLTTVPIEGLVQISDAEEFFWNKEGSIFINDLNATILNITGNALFQGDLNNDGSGSDANFNRLEADFFFGSGIDLTGVLLQNATRALTANWNAGSFNITADNLIANIDINAVTGNFNDINIFDITGTQSSANLRVTSSGITNLETSDGRFRITHPTQDIFLLMGDGASNNANPFKFEPGDGHFQTIPQAGFDLFFFEDSADGENKELRIYGFPSGEQKDFASFRIDGETNDLNIHTEQAGSKVIIQNLNVHEDLNVGRETILTDANITNDLNAMSNIRILDGNLYITEDFGICLNQECTKFITYNGEAIVIQS